MDIFVQSDVEKSKFDSTNAKISIENRVSFSYNFTESATREEITKLVICLASGMMSTTSYMGIVNRLFGPSLIKYSLDSNNELSVYYPSVSPTLISKVSYYLLRTQYPTTNTFPDGYKALYFITVNQYDYDKRPNDYGLTWYLQNLNGKYTDYMGINENIDPMSITCGCTRYSSDSYYLMASVTHTNNSLTICKMPTLCATIGIFGKKKVNTTLEISEVFDGSIVDSGEIPLGVTKYYKYVIEPYHAVDFSQIKFKLSTLEEMDVQMRIQPDQLPTSSDYYSSKLLLSSVISINEMTYYNYENYRRIVYLSVKSYSSAFTRITFTVTDFDISRSSLFSVEIVFGWFSLVFMLFTLMATIIVTCVVRRNKSMENKCQTRQEQYDNL